ncbi:Caffeic acid O-methyltransferase [Quillaja saponaria]|uniref:caffeate O-methyltransferase n=1 Tax=Quillaja saponaria TaxID=32244 RepID=A0AAD7L4S8_QUISA|nr:Caffeic acid O-methyltransferase [Quillaja saponaria]
MAPTEVEKQKMSPTDQEDYLYALELSSASAFPMVMQAATELGLFDIMSKAGSGAFISPQQIASQLHSKNPKAYEMVDRILGHLASYAVVTCKLGVDHGRDGGDQGSSNGVDHCRDVNDHDHGTVQRLYGLTNVAKYFLCNEKDMSLAPGMQLMQNKVFMESWFALKDAVLEGGIPFNKVHGMPAFEYLGKDPKFNQLFNKAMISHTTMDTDTILEKYKGFENIKQLVDVGCGYGMTLNMIVSKYPNIKGINFDLPQVIQNAPQYLGIQNIEGDMFVSVPKGDAIMLKCILHNWSDDQCLKILKNCYTSLQEEGKVIVIDMLLPEVPENTASARFVYNMDLLMMTQLSAGKERTKHEFESLGLSAGFKEVRFACYACNNWIMEFYK